jgi:hypothetical protein
VEDMKLMGYEGPVKVGDLLQLKSGNLGQVMSIRENHRQVRDANGKGLFESNGCAVVELTGTYNVWYQTINSKTGKPWQASREMPVERAEAIRLPPQE